MNSVWRLCVIDGCCRHCCYSYCWYMCPISTGHMLNGLVKKHDEDWLEACRTRFCTKQVNGVLKHHSWFAKRDIVNWLLSTTSWKVKKAGPFYTTLYLQVSSSGCSVCNGVFTEVYLSDMIIYVWGPTYVAIQTTLLISNLKFFRIVL